MSRAAPVPASPTLKIAPTAIIVALLAATAISFAVAERQKLESSPVAVIHVDQHFSPRRGPAAITLRFRRRHLLTLQILNRDGRVVATLAREREVNKGRTYHFGWRGAHVPDGTYDPRVTLDASRTFTLPNPIVLDTVAPSATVASYGPHLLRRGGKLRVRVLYRVSETAHVILYVDGRRVLRGYAKALKSQVQWFARENGRPLPRGRYRLQLAAVDLAGNVGERTPPFLVRIR
jgi:hypothetical protein